MALLFGFMCGHIGASFGKNTKKSVPVVVSKAPLSCVMTIDKLSLSAIINETVNCITNDCISDSNTRNTYTMSSYAGKSVIPVKVTYSTCPFNTS